MQFTNRAFKMKMTAKGEKTDLRSRREVLISVYEELPRRPCPRDHPLRSCVRTALSRSVVPPNGDRRAALLSYCRQLRQKGGDQDQITKKKMNSVAQTGIRLQSWMKRIHCCGGGAGEVKSAAEDEGETLLQQSRVRSFSWKRFKGLIERLPRFWRCCRSPDC
ncbi:uncharacterized protein LOC144713970 isoform X1 [Wolffia australiana]